MGEFRNAARFAGVRLPDGRRDLDQHGGILCLGLQPQDDGQATEEHGCGQDLPLMGTTGGSRPAWTTRCPWTARWRARHGDKPRAVTGFSYAQLSTKKKKKKKKVLRIDTTA